MNNNNWLKTALMSALISVAGTTTLIAFDNTNILVEEAVNHIYQQRYKQAHQTLKQAYEQSPRHPGVHFNLGRLFELTGNFEEALRELEVHNIELSFNKNENKYSVFSLPENYYTYLKVSAIGKKGDCNAEIWNVHHKASDKISLFDPNFKPDFLWRTGLFNVANNDIYFYHNNDYSILSLQLSYIRKLPDVANATQTVGGFYEKADGTIIKEDKHLEISSTALWRKITELAAYYILKARLSTFQGTLEEILFHDSLGKNMQL